MRHDHAPRLRTMSRHAAYGPPLRTADGPIPPLKALGAPGAIVGGAAATTEVPGWARLVRPAWGREMTLDDLFSRVIRAHFVMILAIALIPVAIVLGVGASQARDWRATVRIQTTAAVPTSSTEAEALSSRVLAIATTPSVVGQALSTAGLKGDRVEVAEKHVSAQRLGESPIVELTVTDPDGPEAKALVRALSVQVLRFMNNADRGRFETAVEDVNRRIADSRDQRDRLAKQIQKTPPGDARDRLEQLATEAAKVTSELAAQRASLEMADITRGQAVLVDGSTPTVVRVPRRCSRAPVSPWSSASASGSLVRPPSRRFARRCPMLVAWHASWTPRCSPPPSNRLPTWLGRSPWWRAATDWTRW